MSNPFIRAGQRVVNAVWAFRHGRGTQGRRGFSAAKTGRLFSDWVGTVGPVDEYLRRDLVAMRSNSRRLAMDNDYMKQFLRMVRRNVVGPKGIVLQNRARDPNGALDEVANERIEDAWAKWGGKGTCTVCGRYSWLDVQRVAMSAIARDGEVLVREVRGFPNAFGFALQLIEADWLDEKLNKDLPGGAEIRMGIERDKWGRPKAYHIKVKASDRRYARHERIPAAEVIHLYVPEDPNQSRGWPWAHTAIRRMGMLGGYEEAALVAARAGAAKMGFFQQREGGTRYGPGDEDERGNFINDAEPGHFEVLPEGFEFKEFDPGYPNGEMPFFMKSVLRGAAAGLGVSYNGLANDLEGVNFSSLRGGALEERDEWMVLQGWLIETLHGRVFASFLEQSMLKGVLSLPLSKFDKFNAPQWYPRRWKWVDPDKEGKANARDVGLGIASRTQIAAEQGRDLREVFTELAAEQALAEEMGVTLGDPMAADQSGPQDGTDQGGQNA